MLNVRDVCVCRYTFAVVKCAITLGTGATRAANVFHNMQTPHKISPTFAFI